MRIVWVLLLLSCALLRPMAGLPQVDPAAAVTISLPGTTFAKGAPIRMRLAVQNFEDRLLWMRRDRPEALAPILITSANGGRIGVRRPPQAGERLSAMSGGLQKGESHTEVFDLSKWFLIDQSGVYRVYYELKDADGRLIRSETLSFTVTD